MGLFSEGRLIYPTYGIFSGGPMPGLLKGGNFEPLLCQTIGIVAAGCFTVCFSLVVWKLIKLLLGNSLRVTLEQELLGLDGAFDDDVNARLSSLVRESR